MKITFSAGVESGIEPVVWSYEDSHSLVVALRPTPAHLERIRSRSMSRAHDVIVSGHGGSSRTVSFNGTAVRRTRTLPVRVMTETHVSRVADAVASDSERTSMGERRERRSCQGACR